MGNVVEVANGGCYLYMWDGECMFLLEFVLGSV